MPMSLQMREQLELGDIKVTKTRTVIMAVPNIGTSIAVVLFDMEAKIGGIAHVVLPDSMLTTAPGEQAPAKYADLAIPALMDAFTAEGGQKRSTVVKMAGGAQLFNFGGGGGNILNIGARNATAIRTALSRHGLVVEKADIGGNKSRSMRFILATGQVIVQQVGGGEYGI